MKELNVMKKTLIYECEIYTENNKYLHKGSSASLYLRVPIKTTSPTSMKYG